MLQEAAQRLHADFDRLDMFVTVAIGLVNPRERTLCVANAGHCPIALHLPRRQDLLIEPTALPLGLESQPVIAQQVLSLTEGSHILGFTDGFLDPRSKDHFTSPQALLAWMQALPLNEMDAEAFKGALLAYLSPSQSASADDVTFVNLHLQTA
jgi:serine phosphatase RsbU (regulator of sigma subunit)